MPPPVMWPFAVKAVFHGLLFAAMVFALDRLPLWPESRHGFVHYIGMAVFFGSSMALYSKWRSKRFKLSSWYEQPARDVVKALQSAN